MKWMKRIAVCLAAIVMLVVALLALLSLRPDADRIQASAIVRRSPASIWPWLYEPEKLKAWVTFLQDVKQSSPGEPAAGGESVWVMKDENNGGAFMRIASHVEAVEPARRLALRLESPGAFRGIAAYRLIDLGNGQTRVEVDSRYRFDNWFARFMMPVVAVVAGNKMTADLDRLRILVETR